MSQSGLPSGTVTFLFTDIEGSTKLAQAHPAKWEGARERHDAVLREAFETHRGHVFQVVGDAFCVAFATTPDALNAALDAQRALHATPINQESIIINVRMGLHTGEAEARDGAYQGYLTLSRTQRLVSAASGGQVLISSVSEGLLRDRLPAGVNLRNLGALQLKGFPRAESIYQLVAPDLPAQFAPLKSLSVVPNNLPVQLTSFIGREREVADVKRLLAKTRLLTLTGSGGTGKTRLSLAAAADLSDIYPDGIWLVELAPLADPTLVPQTVGAALRLHEEPGRAMLATLTDYLRDKRLLLVLDNCEHLIAACAGLADALLHATSHLQILASGREALGISGEANYHLPSLPIPNPNDPLTDLVKYDSVRLFVERAVAARDSFAITDANAVAVAQICYRLDGIPLAIELAAARMKAFTPEQVASRLDDRFRLLTGGNRTALPRQQTLRALIDWSYGLLSEPERILLRRLSVFAGGWTLEAAEEVTKDDPSATPAEGLGGIMKDEIVPPSSPFVPHQTGFIPVRPALDGVHPSDVIDLLSHLVDKSLVVLDEQAAEPRYRMLETIRQYAREKLLDAGESERLRDQHLSYFLHLTEDAAPHLSGPIQETWFVRLEQDYANLRAAHEWSLQDSDASRGMQLTTALRTLWSVRGPAMEGVDWSVRAVSRPEASVPSPVRANALLATAHVLWVTGELVRSNAYGEESLAISRALDYRPGVARALYQLGMNARSKGDHPKSKSLLEQSLAVREGLDSNAITTTYVSLGWIAEGAGDYDAARKYFEQVMSIAQAAGSSHDVAMAFAQLGSLAYLQRDYDGAEALLEQGLTAGRAIGYRGAVSQSSRGLAYVALQRRQVERAAAFCREALLINRERRNSLGLTACLAACAALAVARGQPKRATQLYGSAAVLLVGNVGGHHRYPHDQAEQERYITILRAQLDEAAFNTAWEAGRRLTLDQAIALALEETDG